jgi:hypothetical protein
MPLKVKAAIFSECALKLLANQSDLETGALAIELHSYIKDLRPHDLPMLPDLLPKSSFDARSGVYSRPKNHVEFGRRLCLHRLRDVTIQV